ncbi:MAG: ABC transporter ATP-binding protein [Candidatus Aminicenantes bacterium]|nr:ABC transporter ATP-binding protein [Candidatus Aminicenantes bacterium]
MSPDAINVDNIEFSYGNVHAVKGITFDVKEKEIFGFLGPNGAGKSTTIKMLTGQIFPKKGKISVLGMDVTKKTGRVQARIGVSFEQTNLYEQMSAVENLKLFADLFGVKKFDADKLLAMVDLHGRNRDHVSTFSKGMKQRLMLARALVNQPEILFLDEPTEGLDPVSADNIRKIILKERERGAAVFLTTHDMMEADKLSDRVAFIHEGKIVALDSPYHLKQKFGKRLIKVETETASGELKETEITMDEPYTADDVRSLFAEEKVITIHSEEASLEDIFIQITGRGLTG